LKPEQPRPLSHAGCPSATADTAGMTPRAIAQIFGEAERLQAGVYLPASQRTANVLPRDTPIFLNRNGKLAAVFSAHGLTPLAPPPPRGVEVIKTDPGRGPRVDVHAPRHARGPLNLRWQGGTLEAGGGVVDKILLRPKPQTFSRCQTACDFLSLCGDFSTTHCAQMV